MIPNPIGENKSSVSAQGMSPSQSRGRCAIVSGSLGQNNIGDDSLLRAFLKQHQDEYHHRIVMTSQPLSRWPNDLHSNLKITLPRFPIGKRFWYGTIDRYVTKRRVISRATPHVRDYILLGGLLGHIWQHNESRLQEMRWANSFCGRICYYFGDVGNGLLKTPQAHRIASFFNQNMDWISVRSEQAANVLSDAGVQNGIRVGMDPVFYHLCKESFPFKNKKNLGEWLVINPCYSNIELWWPVWIAAAKAGIARGLKIRWFSTSDPTDLSLCRSLASCIESEFPKWPQELSNSERLHDVFKNAIATVATRYHGAIFSIANSVPTIGVPYDDKVQRLFELLGLIDWTIQKQDAHGSNLEFRLTEVLDGILSSAWTMDGQALMSSMTLHETALQEFRRQ